MTEKKAVKKHPAAKAVKKEKSVEPKHAEPKKAHAAPPAKYIFAVGRRKSASARVKLVVEGGGGKTEVNGRSFADYFPSEVLQKIVQAPAAALGLDKTVDADIRVSGGGIRSQALAAALGISRALVMADGNRKTVLKKQGFMTRDARKKERKKPGLKRARRAPQWQKR